MCTMNSTRNAVAKILWYCVQSLFSRQCCPSIVLVPATMHKAIASVCLVMISVAQFFFIVRVLQPCTIVRQLSK